MRWRRRGAWGIHSIAGRRGPRPPIGATYFALHNIPYPAAGKHADAIFGPASAGFFRAATRTVTANVPVPMAEEASRHREKNG